MNKSKIDPSKVLDVWFFGNRHMFAVKSTLSACFKANPNFRISHVTKSSEGNFDHWVEQPLGYDSWFIESSFEDLTHDIPVDRPTIS